MNEVTKMWEIDIFLVPFLKLNGTKVAQIKIDKIRDLCNPSV